MASKTKSNGAVEQPGENILADLVHEIENMDEVTALDAALSLTEQTEMHMFKLGGVLAAIQANNWYEPYQSFKEFCEGKLGMHYRKASYWAAIYNDLVEANIKWSEVAGIGWTKLKEIVSVIDQDNVAAWVDTAKNQTTIQLIETVKAYKQGHSGQIGSHGGDVVSTKTFKLHADQKQTVEDALKKAKDEAGTTYDTAALEFICMDYMGSQKLAAKLKKIGTDHALAALEEAFPELDIEVSFAQGKAS
ncbi:MAG: hypothetical protein LC676_19765 [Loktanella sp.]|nr:hypothetical protein [Loktanella sp.]